MPLVWVFQMKIEMILTNAFAPDVRVYKEARYLVSQGHDLEVLCWDKTPEKGLPEIEDDSGIYIRRFGIPSVEGTGSKQIGAYLSFIRKCRNYLKGEEYDVLHCHDMDGAIAGYLAGRKFIFDMHEFYDKGGQARKLLSHIIVRHLAKKALANIIVSPRSLDTYGKGIEDRFFLLKNYSDSTMFANSEKVPSNTLRIAYIGRVRNQLKEFAALFEAVKDLERVSVDIYGDGPDLDRLWQMAEKMNNVIVHGGFNGIEESAEIYRNTDISFVAYDPSNPNYQGEFEPVKLYEAIFTGTPIIATKSLNPGKFATEMEIGIAVDTQAPEEVRDAICRMRDHRDLVEKYIHNMRAIADNYDWNHAVKILDTVYSLV